MGEHISLRFERDLSQDGEAIKRGSKAPKNSCSVTKILELRSGLVIDDRVLLERISWSVSGIIQQRSRGN